LFHFAVSIRDFHQSGIFNFNRGSILFHKDGRGSGPSAISGERIVIRMQEKQAAEVLETFRNETPVFLWLNDSNHVGGVGTLFEPVGEEES
jgi:hypothetical protein